MCWSQLGDDNVDQITFCCILVWWFTYCRLSLVTWRHTQLCKLRRRRKNSTVQAAHRMRERILMLPFYREMLCIARTVLSQDICLSVCLSHAGILSKPLNISWNFFSPLGSHTIVVFFPYQAGMPVFKWGRPWRGRRMQRYKKSRCSTNISLYLQNVTR